MKLRLRKPFNYDEYLAYIQSPRWMKKRARRLCFDQHKCCYCKGSVRLQVHHLHYDHLFNETMWDLITLCFQCHEELHRDEESRERIERRCMPDYMYRQIVERRQYWEKMKAEGKPTRCSR